MLKKLTLSGVAITLLATSIGACKSTPEATPDSSNGATDALAPGAGVTVRSSNSTWIEEQFLTEIVNIGLERLGYEVEDIKQVDYAALHVSMANGDLDYTPGFYEPAHDSFFNDAGGEEKLEKVGEVVIGGGAHGILVDKKTADEYQLSRLDQLQDSDLAQLFDTDGDGRANLAGCQAGWKCNELIEEQIEVSNLKDTVQQEQGAYEALIADVLARQSQGESILYYAYSPHWLLSKLKPGEDVTWLEVVPTDDSADDDHPGFPINKQRIAASQAFIDENPVAKRWFEVVAIPADDVNAESARISDGEDSPDEIRRHAEEWVENNLELFEGWLEEARKAAG